MPISERSEYLLSKKKYGRTSGGKIYKKYLKGGKSCFDGRGERAKKVDNKCKWVNLA